MIGVLLYDRDKTEQQDILKRVRDNVALVSDERLVCRPLDAADAVEALLRSGEPFDMSVFELLNDRDIGLCKDVRSVNRDAEILLLADKRLSPMTYLTPDVRAASLLLKPFSSEELGSVVRDYISAYFRKNSDKAEEGSIVLESREGRTVIPLSRIYYIEVRGKKVFFRLRDREYSKYDTLDNIRQQLPDRFVQCHRSFIFNTAYLVRVKLSDNTVYLENGISVPLARSYKASVKEYISGLSSE